jgi:tRNA(fMet)-specific endonuclease VapC
MKRYLMDTGIAGLYIDRKRGVYERARAEVARGNRVGIGAPVLGELAYRAEGSPNRDRNIQRLRLALATWRLWPVTEEVAFRLIGQNDIMIAAIARMLRKLHCSHHG